MPVTVSTRRGAAVLNKFSRLKYGANYSRAAPIQKREQREKERRSWACAACQFHGPNDGTAHHKNCEERT